MLVLINRQILFVTIINKFILRNSIYILISTYLLKIFRGKQVSLLVHPICIFYVWLLSEPFPVTVPCNPVTKRNDFHSRNICVFQNPSKKKQLMCPVPVTSVLFLCLNHSSPQRVALFSQWYSDALGRSRLCSAGDDEHRMARASYPGAAIFLQQGIAVQSVIARIRVHY